MRRRAWPSLEGTLIVVFSRLLILFFLFFSPWCLAQERASVLVIESYHSDYQWDEGYTRAIRDVLSDTADVDFFQMDTKRRPPSEYPQHADLAWQTYLRILPDLVILGDDNALKYLGPRFAETGTPLVYLGINNNPRNYFSTLPNNMTGVLERPLLNRSIIYMQQVLAGKLSKVLVLFDDGTTARAVIDDQFKGDSHRNVGAIEVEIRSVGRWNEWQELIHEAPQQGYDAIVVGLYQTLTTADGQHMPDEQIIRWSSANTKLPLFAFWSFAVGADMALGGLVLDGYSQGRAAAAIALKVLAGEKISPIPSSSGQGVFVFSRAQLLKWSVVLPHGIAEQSIFVP
jgi:hypothetical protein